MKKYRMTLLLLAGIAVCAAAAGCGNKKEPVSADASTVQTAEETAEKAGDKADSSEEQSWKEEAPEKPEQPWTEPAIEQQDEKQQDQMPGMVGMPNPITECDSLDEINEKVGCRLSHLGVMGVTDTLYALVDCREFVIARYEFEFLGSRWSFEAAPTQRDISGIYVKGGLISQLAEPGTMIKEEHYRYIRWFDGDMQYSLCAFDSDAVSEGAFEEAVNEFRYNQTVIEEKQ